MAAYAAVISLKHTVNGLLNSSRVSLFPSTREHLEVAYNEATSLQQVLERSNESSMNRSRSSHERVDGLEGQIRDFAHKLEDVLELHEYCLYSDDGDAEEVMRHEITSFGAAVKKMKEDYIEELSRDDADADDVVVPRIDDFGVDMVGHSELLAVTRYRALRRMRPDELCFYAFLGVNGNGRSLPPRTLFEDAREGRTELFDCWAWVTVGTKHPQPQVKEVLMSIISQVRNSDDDHQVEEDDEGKLSAYLFNLLEDRIFMIVLDDVDDVELVDYLRKKAFPDESNGSIVFLTTTSHEVAYMADQAYSLEFMPSYFEATAWVNMRNMFFGVESEVPEEMEVAGKKIIHNCGCRFIAFYKTLMLLFKSDKTVEVWSRIAADTQHPTFMIADETSEINEITMKLQYYDTEFAKFLSAGIDDFCETREKVMMEMHPERFFSKMQIISIFGMAGIGKTTFATKLFKDELVMSHFDHHVWINLGPKYHMEDILIDILAQIYPNINKLHMKEDERLVKDLCAQLSSKRCLIVLDDLCSKEPLHHLKHLFPIIKGRALVTTRLVKVAKFGRDDLDIEMHLLDNEESWSLLQQKVFAGGTCPPGLEKAGRKIAEKCDGLPLLILTVADQLLKVEISQEYWNSVASDQEKSVFRNAHHQISESLLPTYQSIPQHVKPCFLYIAAFREKCQIRMSNLTHLWISEGLIESNSSMVEEDFVAECLSELVDKSIVMVQRKVLGSQIKSCRLHSVFWHLSNTQAEKNKFFNAMNTFDDCSMEKMASQRRSCIRNSGLLGLKYVQKSMASNTRAHSLLCVGPFHQYPVPLNFELSLLRVVNAITIRFYKFPVEVVKLIHLQYLSLMCNEELPTSISNLWKLQYLIVKRYMSINSSSQKSSHLPVEIWDMKELKHLQVTGGCLPNRKCGSAGLLKLSTLLDVSAQSLRKKVLKGMPNLTRLGIRIELVPNDEGNPFRCLNRISRLRRLESLKCVVVNPQIRSEVVSPPAPVSMFPQSLKKLSLNGLGYPWEYMSIIGKLKNLEVLKLKCYAFEGATWEMDDTYQFEKLKFLLVEDTNLVHWKFNAFIEMSPKHLCIKHCYELKEPPIYLSIGHLNKLEIVDCSPFTMTWAKQMEDKISSCETSVHDSWPANTTKNESQLDM